VARSCERGNEPLDSIKCGKVFWQAEDLLAYQEGLCSMEVIRKLVS
jgi:hypothetical protein